MGNEWKTSQFNVTSSIPGTNKVILYNSATGSIACFKEEAYNNLQNGLLKDDDFKLCCEQGFLVPEDKDELAAIAKHREEAIRDDEGIARFTIAPTLACNARCFYCFEPKNQMCSMSDEVVSATINFIRKQSKGKNVAIHWFGGEPLIMHKVIDRITEAVKETIGDKTYFASMATNASLFTDDIVAKLKDWCMDFVQVTMDGTEEEYIKRKDYVNKIPNQYELVIQNIEKLLKAGVYVKVRINVDKGNVEDAINLIHELTDRFKGKYKRFSTYVFPLSGSSDDSRLFKSNELKEPLTKLYAELFKAGYICNFDNLSLNPRKIHCGACKPNSFNIDPKGDLFKCEHLIGRSKMKVGTVFDGVTNKDRYDDWVSTHVDKKCLSCKLLPVCQGGCTVNTDSNLGGCLPIKSMLEELLILAYGIHLKGGIDNDCIKEQNT